MSLNLDAPPPPFPPDNTRNWLPIPYPFDFLLSVRQEDRREPYQTTAKKCGVLNPILHTATVREQCTDFEK
jgi:hypothetical protein